MTEQESWLEERAAADVPLASGTYAERLARAGCCAEHALWALRHGADWQAGWSSCPRADWLAEAYVLTTCREGGGDNHRRLVGWIGLQVERAWSTVMLQCDPSVRPRVERVALAVRAAAGFAIDWGKRKPGGPPDFAALAVSALFDEPESDWTAGAARGQARTPDGEALALAHAALRAACSALSGDMPGAALLALSWHRGWSDEAPALAREFAAAFPCPTALRCELPS
jgi:hypothetical protein